MTKQIIFSFTLLLTLGVFAYTINRIVSFFKLTRPFPIKDFGKRFWVMFDVAFLQSKIFRKPGIGLLHAFVFWGFCVILFGSIEMVIDGITGSERCLSGFGWLYDFIIASGDIYVYLVALSIVVFLSRRLFMHIKRFTGIEMEHKSHMDANIALTIILVLMLSLIGMNTFYSAAHPDDGAGVYPLSQFLALNFANMSMDSLNLFYEICWWTHILLIFLFANILPYSKHFHVFMSVPNVFLSRLDPLGKLPNMENVTREVKLMLNPDTAFTADASAQPISRFGVKDVEDVTWKNYFDSLSCTECGRCTSVCPANTTGKKLSPRKVMMNLRARMKEVGPLKVKNGKDFSDNRSLVKDWISEEEIWACTTCNACAQECPININHPTLIVDLRRYLVMEEAAAPAELNAIFTNIENNGAPWQFSSEDRMLWAKDLTINQETV